MRTSSSPPPSSQPPVVLPGKRKRGAETNAPPAKRPTLNDDRVVHSLRSGKLYVSPAARPARPAPPAPSEPSPAARASEEIWVDILKYADAPGLYAMSTVDRVRGRLAFDALVLAAQPPAGATVASVRRHARTGDNMRAGHFRRRPAGPDYQPTLATAGIFAWHSRDRVQASRDVALYSSDAGEAEIWDTRGRIPRHNTLAGVTGQIGAAAASDDGTRMIALTPELRGVTVWALSARDGATVGGASLRHRDAIKVAITPDGRFGASGAYDGTIRFWDLRTFEASTLQHSHITALAISPNGTSVAAAYGEEVRVWLRSLGAAHPGFDLEHTAYVNRMAFSPNGKFLAARGNRLMELWRVREVGVDKVPTPKLQHGSSEALGVFSPDSRFFASANEANDAVLVFDLHAVDKPGPWEPRTLRYRKSISRIDFSPQLHRLMATTGRGLRVWDLDSEAPARPLLTKQLEHDEAHFAAEGSQIMLVPSRGTTEVLDFDIQRAAPASV